MRTQWFSSMSQGSVVNSMFIFLEFMPFVLVESMAEVGLGTFELAPSLHTSGALIERPVIVANGADAQNIVQTVRVFWSAKRVNSCSSSTSFFGF
jgi:hypothetical protein